MCAHLSVEGETVSLLHDMRLLAEDAAAGTAAWEVLDGKSVVLVQDRLCAVIWSKAGDCVVTIVPFYLLFFGF